MTVLHECEFCHQSKPDVEQRPDPFVSEVWNDDTLHWICAKCYDDRADEV